MKLNQQIFMNNLVECSRQCYVKAFYMAIHSDFCCNKDKLYKLDHKLFSALALSRKKPKKIFKTFVYVASLIYNNEIITDSVLCYNLNILIMINKLHLYKAHKFIKFIENNGHINYCVVPGIKSSQLNTLINDIMRGVKC